MTNDADNVRVAVTGAVSYAALDAVGLAAPTGTASTLTPRVDVGYISEDGVEITFPDSGDKTPIKAWQNGATVRTIRTPSEDYPQVHFTILETNLNAVELAFSTVTQTATEGQYDYVSTSLPDPIDMVLDVIDGAELIRNHIPRAVKVSIGSLVYKNAEPIGYEITVDCELDSTAGYNLRTWATALKTP